MISIDRVPLVRDGGRPLKYYILSEEEVVTLNLITADLIERANAIMLRVMKIEDETRVAYACTSVQVQEEEVEINGGN